ncbi:hypothetical protein LXL04_036322 [Taraxacum kok-saghyz]
MEMGGGSSGSSESQLLKIGLQFGKEIYFEDVGVGAQAKSEGGLSAASGGGDAGGPQKKGRTAGGGAVAGVLVQGQQPPRCQVEGCNLDLSDAKTYYSRHKVCGAHSKTAKVIVNGLEQRFCQQCSSTKRENAFNTLFPGSISYRNLTRGKEAAGDDWLATMNVEGSHLCYPLAMELSPPRSLLCSNDKMAENNGNSGGFLMDFSSCSRGRVQWPGGTRVAPLPRTAIDLPISGEKFPPLPWQSHLDNPPPYVPPGGCYDGVQEDSNCALSLLSNHSSASRNQTLCHEYYVNPEAGAHVHQLQQPGTGTMVQVHYSTSTTTSGGTGWVYETEDAHLGLGQVGQSGGYSGEVGLGQPGGGRRYDSSDDHIDWSL